MSIQPSSASLPPIQGLWVAGALPPIQALSIRSFLANGHSYELYSYEEIPNVPKGASLLPASLVMPESEVFVMRGNTGFKDSPAPFADLFRYKLLLDRGGWWVDLDFVCLRPFDFSTEWVFASERNADGSRLKTNSVIKAPPNSDLMAECYERARTHRDRDRVWGAVGAHLLHPGIAKRGLSHFTQPPETFCPIDWSRAEELVNPAEIPEGPYAIHLWNSMWSQADWSQEPNYPPDVLYQRLHHLYPTAEAER